MLIHFLRYASQSPDDVLASGLFLLAQLSCSREELPRAMAGFIEQKKDERDEGYDRKYEC